MIKTVFVQYWSEGIGGIGQGAGGCSLHLDIREYRHFVNYNHIPSRYSNLRPWDSEPQEKEIVDKKTYEAIVKSECGIFLPKKKMSGLERKLRSLQSVKKSPIQMQGKPDRTHSDIGNVYDSDSDRYAAGISNAE